MNLSKLFEIQKLLRDRIGYNEPDRFNKLILALQVELGECANEHRGFKFWSVNQLPHISAVRVPCMMEEDKEYYNPLLEEYVDGLHFILELGIEKDYEKITPSLMKKHNVTQQFIYLFDSISQFYYTPNLRFYTRLCNLHVGLGEMLGFTWEQIETAYLEKNKINHQRQEVGY